jgi:hypothetical protein
MVLEQLGEAPEKCILIVLLACYTFTRKEGQTEVAAISFLVHSRLFGMVFA